jgi:hypothetical protein
VGLPPPVNTPTRAIGHLSCRFDADSDAQLAVGELRVMVTQVELFSYFTEDTASLFALLDVDNNDFLGWQVRARPQPPPAIRRLPAALVLASAR